MNENEESDLQEQEFALQNEEELEDGELAKTDELEIDNYKVEIVAEEFDKELSENDIYQDLLKVEGRLCGTEDLINYADKWDYLVSVSSGIVCGLIDSFFVGEFDIGKAASKDRVNIDEIIKKVAKNIGYENKGGDQVKGSIRKLEKKFPVPQDSVLGEGVSRKTHHLDDFAHHPTPIGLIAAVLAQYVRIAVFTNKNGKWSIVAIETDKKELVKILLPALISGLLVWLSNIVEDYIEKRNDEEIPEYIRSFIKLLATVPLIIDILRTAINWVGHLFSDVNGSSGSAKEGESNGMGIPGLYLSFLKEVASLPFFKDSGLSEELSRIYTSGQFDMRKELSSIADLGKMAIPVIINTALVRGFYLIRALVDEYKKHNGFRGVNTKRIASACMLVPNRTLVRMLTISKGVFTAFDAADAAIRSKGNTMGFLLHINFVGAGSFVITAGIDVGMGIKKFIKERKYENQMNLKLIKLYQKNAREFSSVFKNYPEAKKASGPLFLHFEEKHYKDKNFKIMFVGTDNNLELSYLTVRKENDTILPLFEECKNLDIEGTKFGSFAKNIVLALNGNSAKKNFVLWNSIFKFSNHVKKDVDLAKDKEPSFLYHEIKICNPDAVVFMTGNKYDEIIKKRLGDDARFEEICRKKTVSLNQHKKTRLPNMSASRFAKVFCKKKGLPEHIYRISNPKSPFFFFKKKSTYNWLVALLRESPEEKDDVKAKKPFAAIIAIAIIVFAIIFVAILLRNCNSKPRMEEVSIVYEQPLTTIREEIQEVPIRVEILYETRSAYFKGDKAEFENINEADKWFDFMANEINSRLQKNPESRFVVMGHYAEFQNEINGPALSKRRANIIAKGLLKRGVPQMALIVKGEEKPTKRWSQTDRRENRVATVYSEE